MVILTTHNINTIHHPANVKNLSLKAAQIVHRLKNGLGLGLRT